MREGQTIADVLEGRADWVVVTGDCLQVLPTIPKGSVGACVTDPPYGIGYEASRYTNARFVGVLLGDDTEFDPRAILDVGVPSVLWGGNNFAHRLPRGGWLCWDKRTNEAADLMVGSPFEMAWCSIPQRFNMLRVQHGGAINADGTGIARVHPTQKPVRVMAWSIEQVNKVEGAVILDPYCGSGTTGVACIKTGRRFIGIEICDEYAAIARRRIREAEPVLFTRAKSEQGEMFKA